MCQTSLWTVWHRQAIQQDGEMCYNVHGNPNEDDPVRLRLVLHVARWYSGCDFQQGQRCFWAAHLQQVDCVQTAEGVCCRKAQSWWSPPKWPAQECSHKRNYWSLQTSSAAWQEDQHPQTDNPVDNILWNSAPDPAQGVVLEEEGQQIHPPHIDWGSEMQTPVLCCQLPGFLPRRASPAPANHHGRVLVSCPWSWH